MTNGFLAGYLEGYMSKQAQIKPAYSKAQTVDQTRKTTRSLADQQEQDYTAFRTSPEYMAMSPSQQTAAAQDFLSRQPSALTMNYNAQGQGDKAAANEKYIADTRAREAAAGNKALAHSQEVLGQSGMSDAQQSARRNAEATYNADMVRRSGTQRPAATPRSGLIQPTNEEYMQNRNAADPLTQTGATPTSTGAVQGRYGQVSSGSTGKPLAAMQAEKKLQTGLTPPPAAKAVAAPRKVSAGEQKILAQIASSKSNAGRTTVSGNTVTPPATQTAAKPVAPKPGA